MQQRCGLQGRTCASLARTSPEHAELDAERLSLHRNSEGKCYPVANRRSIICEYLYWMQTEDR